MPIECLTILRLETHSVTHLKIGASSSFPNFLIALAPFVKRLQFIVPIGPIGGEKSEVELRAGDRLFPLPRCEGFFRAYGSAFRLFVQLIRARRRSPLILCRVPEHLNALLFPLVFLLGFKVFVWLVGDRKGNSTSSRLRRADWKSNIGLLISDYTGVVERRAMQMCVGVIVNGQRLANRLESEGVEKSRIHAIVSSTLSYRYLPPSMPERPDRPLKTILYVGRISAEKGLADLVRSLSIIREKMGNVVRLLVVGWDSKGELARLQADIERYEIKDAVEFVGPVPFGRALFDLYRVSDLFVLPSLIEGTPRVLVEAMAFGLPVVATDVGGVSDLVENDVNGFLVPPGCADQLAERIARLLGDTMLRSKMGFTNWKKAKKYSVEAVAESMISFIETLDVKDGD